MLKFESASGVGIGGRAGGAMAPPHLKPGGPGPPIFSAYFFLGYPEFSSRLENETTFFSYIKQAGVIDNIHFVTEYSQRSLLGLSDPPLAHSLMEFSHFDKSDVKNGLNYTTFKKLSLIQSKARQTIWSDVIVCKYLLIWPYLDI